jgi:tetratricopeptide (TPR) repeat protein
MDAAKLYRLMDDAALLNKDTLPGLKQLVDDYPYFQTARMLYLKNLAVLNDLQFGAELKKTAIYIPDRKMLYMFIEDVRLILKRHAQEQLPETENPFDLIDSFLKGQSGEEPDPMIVLPPSVNQDYVLWTVRQGQSLEKENENTSPALKHEELINKYLADELLGSRRWMAVGDDTLYATPDSIDKLNQEGKEGQSLDDSYFTETLAKVYFKQKRYEKALEIIQNLSLKYPKKNIYFADQIRFLEKLIINTKKNS